MIKLYSKQEPDKLLHIINLINKKTLVERTEIAPPEQFLQLCLLNVQEGRKFPPHKHIWRAPSFEKLIAQESWIVVQGSVKLYFYDIDDELLSTHVLGPGDCSMTFEGGHAYEILSPDTLVYEYKTGPYLGQKLDKVFIEEDSV